MSTAPVYTVSFQAGRMCDVCITEDTLTDNCTRVSPFENGMLQTTQLLLDNHSDSPGCGRHLHSNKIVASVFYIIWYHTSLHYCALRCCAPCHVLLVVLVEKCHPYWQMANGVTSHTWATGLLSAATGLLSAATGLLSAATGLLSAATGLLSAATGLLSAATGLHSRQCYRVLVRSGAV